MTLTEQELAKQLIAGSHSTATPQLSAITVSSVLGQVYESNHPSVRPSLTCNFSEQDDEVHPQSFSFSSEAAAYVQAQIGPRRDPRNDSLMVGPILSGHHMVAITIIIEFGIDANSGCRWSP